MHGHVCCAGSAGAIEDPRFAEDEFTSQALQESRTRANHAHAKGLVASVLGGLLVVGVFKTICAAFRR